MDLFKSISQKTFNSNMMASDNFHVGMDVQKNLAVSDFPVENKPSNLVLFLQETLKALQKKSYKRF